MSYPPLPGLLPGSTLNTQLRDQRVMLPDGTFLEQKVEQVALAYLPVGELTFPSGQVIVSDLYGFGDTPPQARPVPSGSHPFEIITTKPKGERARAAFAVLRLSREPTISFVSADRVGDVPAPRGECAGVGVDAGAICLGDASLKQSDWAIDPRQDDAVDAALSARLACVWKPVPTHAAIAACTSGMGDGVYAVTWGRDARNRLTCLLIDFEIVEWKLGALR
jgi:hypothetical protein